MIAFRSDHRVVENRTSGGVPAFRFPEQCGEPSAYKRGDPPRNCYICSCQLPPMEVVTEKSGVCQGCMQGFFHYCICLMYLEGDFSKLDSFEIADKVFYWTVILTRTYWCDRYERLSENLYGCAVQRDELLEKVDLLESRLEELEEKLSDLRDEQEAR